MEKIKQRCRNNNKKYSFFWRYSQHFAYRCDLKTYYSLMIFMVDVAWAVLDIASTIGFDLTYEEFETIMDLTMEQKMKRES